MLYVYGISSSGSWKIPATLFERSQRTVLVICGASCKHASWILLHCMHQEICSSVPSTAANSLLFFQRMNSQGAQTTDHTTEILFVCWTQNEQMKHYHASSASSSAVCASCAVICGKKSRQFLSAFEKHVVNSLLCSVQQYLAHTLVGTSGQVGSVFWLC